MKKISFGAACGTVLLSLAGGLFTPTATHAAAIYTGTFDPRGDVYGFAGTYKFAVDPNCLLTNGVKQVNVAGTGDCGDVVLIGGTLRLRKYAAPGTDENAATVLDQTFDFSTAQQDWDPGLVWGPEPGNVGGMKNYISEINVVGNQLYGVDTPALFGTFGLFDNTYWGLEFFSGAPGRDRGVKLLVNCDSPFTPTRAVCAGPGTDPNSPFIVPVSTNVTFSLVPEPGSLALVTAALFAAGIGSRRSRGG